MSEQVEKEMPRYVSHKQVWALEIAGIEFHRLTFKEAGYEPLDTPDEMWARYKPVVGDFFVQYADGYKSFSPRKAFLEGYSNEASVKPSFRPGTMIADHALVVDQNGIAWWVRPLAMQLARAV